LSPRHARGSIGGMGGETQNALIEQTKALLLAVFSWVILTATGVIVSGKLLARRIPLGVGSTDLFSINLVAFRIKATGDEVVLGLLLFGLALGSVVWFGGLKTYQFFRLQTGLDVGQWNSLCVVASFYATIVSTIIWVAAPLFGAKPLINSKERDAQIRTIERNSEDDEAGDSNG
jgi:hypothetical protein